MTYCFDANAFIGPWRRTYPPDVFPSYWEMVDQMMNDGEVLIISEAHFELEVAGDELYEWVSSHGSAIVALDTSIQQAARDILEQFPGMINVRKQKSMADPFVVGHAQVIGGTVVTEESKSGDKKHPRIPDVCDMLKITCINPLQFIRALGLVFRTDG